MDVDEATFVTLRLECLNKSFLNFSYLFHRLLYYAIRGIGGGQIDVVITVEM